MAQEKKRVEIAALIRAGHSHSEISRTLNVSRTTVIAVNKKVEAGEDLSHAPGAGRPRVIATSTVKAAFRANPNRRMTAVAKARGVSKSTISRRVKEAGGYAYRLRSRPLLSEATRERRFARSKALFSRLRHQDSGAVIFFSDEKTFDVDPSHNHQNDRCIAFGGPPDVNDPRGVSTTTKHAPSAMMLGVVGSDGSRMNPVWFPTGYRLTGRDYVEVLKNHVKPFIEGVVGDAPYVFQQDGAPAHTSKVAQEWLDGNLHFWDKNLWPPQSPDLNPLDYAI